MSIRKGFLISLASSNVSMLISFVASIFLARLLTPHEIGIFSVAYVFAGLLRTIREMGLGSYIVQEQELTTARFRTAFGISIVIALVTAAILAALAGYAGEFYREPGITQAIYVIAASFLLVPFGATTLSFLRRELRFVDIAVIETVSAVVQNLSAIGMAWLGFGFMSLAWSSLLGILASVLMVLFYRPKSIPWLPSLSEWRRVLSFSSFVSGSALVNYINFSANDLVLGRMLNVSSVALFNRASGLAEMIGPMILRAVNAVSLPYFAEKNREGQELLPAFLRSSALLATIAVPVYLVMLVVAEPIISILYGEQWLESVVVLKWLCLAAILRTPLSLSSNLLTAVGEVRQVLALDVKSLLIKLILVVFGAMHGLEAVAVAYCVATVATNVLRYNAVSRFTGMKVKQLVDLHKQVVIPCLFAIIGPACLTVFQDNNYVILFGTTVLSSIGWLCAVLLFANPMGDEIRSVVLKGRERFNGQG